MNAIMIVSGVLAAGLFIYLLVALFRAEDF
ncbi:K(+)-transporting ATPase subunit F [Pigmentiphaga litoralis]|uniref:K+-transporting ATPase KdpF subunit n=1 Tax=Pigmentiphaga litoralis TaxID=516702 RepID=A0A7Y9IU19_9BURK|nr:F subunit of K+-transporting ATPase [uncultured organism]NYE23289.1 K+-transporting ATPase KdpF subunit [Pigmentiphaga litoralis]NYE83097.1 K+-transporting ATPase KdpF subunit [Pigmentiphaga litoralis]